MGALTRAQIVTRGLLAAGNTSLTTRANEWLNSWLRSQYAAVDWPFLQKRASGISVASATSSLVVGAGNNGITDVIRRIHDPIYVYNTGKTVRTKMRVSTLLDGPLSWDEDVRPDTAKGVPDRCKLRPVAGTEGAWTMVLNRNTDRALLFSFDYTYLPANITETSAGDASVPEYPNDETLIKCVEAYALKHEKADNYPTERDVLAQMALNDRIKYGSALGINDTWGLDPKVFR